MNRGQRAGGRDARGGAETDQHPGDAPVGLLAAGPVGRELLGDVAVGTQALGRAIQQLDRQVLVAPTAQGEQNDREPAKALPDPVQRQALASIGVGGGGCGSNAAGQGLAAGTEAVGSAPPGIGDGGFQSVPGLEPLPDEIPEGDERHPQPLIRFPGRLEAPQSHDLAEYLEGLGRSDGFG